MSASPRAAGVGFALLSASAFSTLGLFAKLVYAEGFSVPQALAWRFTVAAAVLWALVLAGRRKVAMRDLWPLALLGVFGFAPQAGLYFLAVSILDPGITSLLLYLYPAFVIALGALFLRRKPGRPQTVALILSLLGCALAFFKPGSYPVAGLALGVLVGLAYGAYLLVGERVLEGRDPLVATATIMLVSAIVYWAAAAATGTVKAPSNLLSLAGIAGLALVASVVSITSLFAALRRIGAADTSLLSTLEPLLTVLLSALILGERLAPPQALGGALILAGLLALRLVPPGKGRAAAISP